MMYKNICLIYLFIFNWFFANSQNNEVISSSQIQELNNEIIKSYKKSECYNKRTEIKTVNLFYFYYPGEVLEVDFSTKVFISKLKPAYQKRGKKEYLPNDTYIYDKDTNLIAVSHNLHTLCLSTYKSSETLWDKNLFNELISREYKIAFILIKDLTELGLARFIFLIDNNDDISIIREYEKNIEILGLDELINEYWKEFTNTLITHEQWKGI